ncbi:MAG: hypothetical protein HY923_06520 [Elusimicrobia bacterium]|nr:hypothetical protein [Elusimicrobiota bacterium]
MTVAFKGSSSNKWKKPSGATTVNSVGKIKESSYLFNLYLLHEPGKVVDPYIVVANFYAPWGTIYAGDIAPQLNPLSVAGQGMRGGMLEQKRGRFDWALLGGQTITSQPGTALTNGRYARTLYAGKAGVELAATVKTSVNMFLSNDETGSLSSDPKSANFRGPSLVAQKNSGQGLDLSWEPRPKLKFLVAYQKNTFSNGTNVAKVADTAKRVEIGWERKTFKLKSYVQEAGTNFVAFGAPAVVGDRRTMDVSLSVYPAAWYTLSLAANQYNDNLKNNPAKVTTTQRVVNMGHGLQFKSKTSINLNVSLNTAKGKPSTALDNQTTTMGLGIGQGIKSHSISLNVQSSQFRDKNGLAHNLDTQIIGFSSSWRLPRRWGLSLGLTNTTTKDKKDGSKRTSSTFGPGLSVPLNAKWTSQYWGTYTATKNTSPAFPADSTSLSVNSEFTWARTPQNNLTFGVGGNRVKDKIIAANTTKEITASFRCSYSF